MTEDTASNSAEYQDFDIYERTQEFARQIILFHRTLPECNLKFSVGDRLLRSGTAIGANLREAKRARSGAEFRSKMGHALQEAEEALYWLVLFPDTGLGSAERIYELESEADEIVAILVSSLN